MKEQEIEDQAQKIANQLLKNVEKFSNNEIDYDLLSQNNKNLWNEAKTNEILYKKVSSFLKDYFNTEMNKLIKEIDK